MTNLGFRQPNIRISLMWPFSLGLAWKTRGQRQIRKRHSMFFDVHLLACLVFVPFCASKVYWQGGPKHVSESQKSDASQSVKNCLLVAPLATFATTSELRHCFLEVEPGQAQEKPLSRS